MERIEDCLSFIVGKAYQRVTQATKQALAPYGVTPAQYAVLKVLWDGDSQSSAAIGERLQLDSATMTGVLDRLGAAGLVERLPHETDRRINRVKLTERGREVQAPLDAAIDGVNAALLARFSPEDGARLSGLLAALGAPEAGR